MSFLLVGAGVVALGSGITKTVMGANAKKKAAKEEEAAKAQMAQDKENYMAQDTSNPFANMENTMEDLTVNQGQAEFQKQQQQQNQANVMSNMQGAAGGSGIAGLAQAMANQGSKDAQQASVSIGQQESQNQMAQANMAGQIQSMERKGEVMSRDWERDKAATALGMSQQEVGAAREAKAAGQQQMMDGIGQIGSTASSMAGI